MILGLSPNRVEAANSIKHQRAESGSDPKITAPVAVAGSEIQSPIEGKADSAQKQTNHRKASEGITQPVVPQEVSPEVTGHMGLLSSPSPGGARGLGGVGTSA